MKDIRPLFAPNSVAIVGASERRHHGKQALDALRAVGYSKPIYLVNPSRKEVWGEPCYSSLTNTPTTADAALLVVGRDRVLNIVEKCGTAGVRAVIVNTDGFADSAEDTGRRLQQALTALVDAHGILLCGPNCLGVINRHDDVAVYCGPLRAPILRGNLSFISQSGGNCSSFMELAYARNIGMSYVVSSGNEAGLDICDYLEYVIEDVHTQVICTFLESIRDPRRFLALGRKAVTAGKPIVCVKIGKSETARVTALAHTGALAGSDEAVQALFDEVGIIRSSSLDEAIDQCSLFSLAPRERWPNNGRVAVFTIGGGIAGMISDLAPNYGLELTQLPERVKENVQSKVPETVHSRNPFDLPGAYIRENPNVFTTYVSGCLGSDVYDGMVLSRSMPGPGSLDYLDGIRGLPTKFGKPVVVTPPVESDLDDDKREFMRRSDATLIPGPRRALKAFQASVRFQRFRQKARSSLLALPVPHLTGSLIEKFDRHVREGKRILDHDATYELLAEFGFPLVPQDVVSGETEAVECARRLGFPVVAKLVNSEGAVHKTELGAVFLNLNCEGDVAIAARKLAQISPGNDLLDSKHRPILIQKSITSAMEMYLGALVPDDRYPPMVFVGAGGIFVEALRDFSRALAPLGKERAFELISSLAVNRILCGTRAQPAYDIGILAETLVKLGNVVAAAEKYISEVDLNPFLLQRDAGGGHVIDAVISLKTSEDLGKKL